MIRSFALIALAFAALATAAPVTEQVHGPGDGTSSLTHEVAVAAPPQAVWEAISTVEGWKSWAVPVAWADGDTFETSYNPAARPGDPMNIKNRFVASVPGRRLTFRTVKAPQGFQHFDSLSQIEQTFELAPEGTGTRVRLTGSGYSADEGGKAMLDFFRGGNRASLEMLRDRFEKGPVDWAEKLRKPLK
jgi:uncharacterized protein YndB with AHSA1/START domain